ncbi:GNAT family N-acetyltransferase [Poriferisphaera sp. WC338]|uniref:GNAT family N-acetyltransferase n=1 Tax=Poriferisphaera sp. WC338 TaxID=3425129 RepID=UPI003D819414
MATVNPLTVEANGGDGLWFGLCPQDLRRQGLSVLLTGRSRVSGAAVDQMERFAVVHGFSLEQLWVAVGDGVVRSAVLVVPAAGGSGMVFVSPVMDDAGQKRLARLLGMVLEQQDGSLGLLQVLLDQDQLLAMEAATEAGFTYLAELLYLSCVLKSGGSVAGKLDLGVEMTVYEWSEVNRELFARAILSSYEATQDCPGLVGIREIDQIIAGHMATGVFDATLWHAVYDGNEPVGVLLLSGLADGGGCELVYLGLSLKFRGKGYAKRMMQWGITIASERNHQKMLCAVDAQNSPAVALYQSLGFESTGSKHALIYTVKQVEK